MRRQRANRIMGGVGEAIRMRRPIQTLFAMARWLYLRKTQQVQNMGGILFCDRRSVRDPSTEALATAVQAALASLTAAESDLPVKETITGIVAIDGPDWVHYGFGLYEGRFDGLLKYPEPIAMRLLWVGRMAQLYKRGIISRQRLSLEDRQRIAYESIQQFARRSDDPDLALEYAREYYKPRDTGKDVS
jgi:hypothetical protein